MTNVLTRGSRNSKNVSNANNVVASNNADANEIKESKNDPVANSQCSIGNA